MSAGESPESFAEKLGGKPGGWVKQTPPKQAWGWECADCPAKQTGMTQPDAAKALYRHRLNTKHDWHGDSTMTEDCAEHFTSTNPVDP